MWESGTLCITIAANIADTAILKYAACFPDSVVGFIPDERVADVRFVKYSIDTIKLQMQNISRGTTQDNLSVDKLLTFCLPTPPLDLQRRIAGIVSAYDDLIENNTRRIAILEELADAPPSTEISDQDVDSIFEALTRDDPDAERLLGEPLPGFGEGIANAGDWTAPLLRIAFSVLADRWGVTAEDLLAHTIEQVRTLGAERVEDRMRRERLLPDASTLHVLTRYEANLHRMCVQSMHELEAAQARRTGHAAPLARVDLQLLERT